MITTLPDVKIKLAHRRTRETAAQKLCQHLCVCEDNIVIDGNFFKNMLSELRHSLCVWYIKCRVNGPGVLYVSVISSFPCRPRCTVRSWIHLRVIYIKTPLLVGRISNLKSSAIEELNSKPLRDVTYKTHKRHVHAGFEPAIPDSERSLTNALDRAAAGIGKVIFRGM
jgi:hypothetical protein